MSQKVTYLDHAATTPVAPEVVQAMLPYLTEKFGNPSSSHRLGIEAHQALEEGRRTLAGPMGCRPSGVILTGGGTEADVLALRGAVAASQRSRHIVISAIEHSAVLNTARSLEKMGHRLTGVPVEPDGIMTVERFVDAIEEDTAVASIMAVNNELGTIQPIAEISRLTKQRRRAACSMSTPCRRSAASAAASTPGTTSTRSRSARTRFTAQGGRRLVRAGAVAPRAGHARRRARERRPLGYDQRCRHGGDRIGVQAHLRAATRRQCALPGAQRLASRAARGTACPTRPSMDRATRAECLTRSICASRARRPSRS